jgi:hypothetical protein
MAPWLKDLPELLLVVHLSNLPPPPDFFFLVGAPASAVGRTACHCHLRQTVRAPPRRPALFQPPPPLVLQHLRTPSNPSVLLQLQRGHQTTTSNPKLSETSPHSHPTRNPKVFGLKVAAWRPILPPPSSSCPSVPVALFMSLTRADGPAHTRERVYGVVRSDLGGV